MNSKPYVTREEGEALKFGYDYRQCFEHESSQPKTMPEYKLVRDFVRQTEYEKMLGLEVMKFLFQFTFATHSQLVRLLELKGIDPAGLDENIKKMLVDRKMNSFYLNQYSETGPAPDDAFVIYCLDFGALAILNHFSNSDSNAWFTTDSCRSSELILKYLSTAEFYLALAEARGDKLRYFKPIFDVSFKYQRIRFSASFEVLQGFTPHSFLLESIRSYDLPANWRDKVDEKVCHFAIGEENWAKYFPAPGPVYIFLVENEKDALEAADIFYRRVEKDNFRLITDDQVRKGLSNAKFLKYIPDPADPKKVGTLKATRASILSGND